MARLFHSESMHVCVTNEREKVNEKAEDIEGWKDEQRERSERDMERGEGENTYRIFLASE